MPMFSASPAAWGAWLFDATSSEVTRIASPSSSMMEQRLFEGKRAMHAIRCRVGVSMVVFACVFSGFSWVVYFTAHLGGWGWKVATFTLAPTVACLILLGLAPLDGDVRFTKFALMGTVVNVFGVFVISAQPVFSLIESTIDSKCLLCEEALRDCDGQIDSIQVYCWAEAVADIAQSLISIVYILRSCTLLANASSFGLQARMWSNITLWLAFMCMTNVMYNCFREFVLPKPTFEFLAFVAVYICAMGVSTQPRVREVIHTWLRHVFQSHTSTAAAAGISSLIGDCSPSDAISQARSRFRAIFLTQLHEHDFLTSPIQESPVFAISHRAHSTMLGSCDAFVSHSWHDAPELKWKALQQWRVDFLSEHGREPSIWFDKACIDQNDIENDLRCLPIFLSGCKQLLIFLGSTYLQRLWCIMELFTFVHMGGSAQRVHLVPLMREGHEQEDARLLKSTFKEFSANSCECFNPADRAKMFEIIRCAFGTIDRFNDAVRTVLDQVEAMQSVRLTDDSLVDVVKSEFFPCAIGKSVSNGD